MPLPLIICEGDSITIWNDPLDWPAQLSTLLGGAWDVVNVALSGDQLSQMIIQAQFQVDPLYDASRPRNVVAVFGGTNDFYFGADLATVQADTQTYCEDRRAIGFEVFVFTILPRNDAAQPAHENNRQAFNSWLRANWMNFADRLVDLAADDRIGDWGDQNDATYYADTVHPSVVGSGVLAQHVFGTLNLVDYTLSAGAGIFIEVGQAAAFSVGRRVTVSAGIFAEVGQSASFLLSRRLAAATTTFTLTGSAAILSSGVIERGRVISLRDVPYIQPPGRLEYIQPPGQLEYVER